MNRANLTLCVKVLCVMAFMALSLILVFGLTIEWWGPRLGTWLAEPGLAHPIQADAIVVLGSTTDRVQHGSELFEAGFAPRMAITGSSSNTYDSAMTEAARARDRAIACGIPAGSIDLLGGTSSYEDALAIKDYVERNAINSITLVSDWPHARRAAASLEAVLGESNLTFGFSAVATPYQPDNWWKSEAGIVRVLIELGQSAFYWSAHGVHTWQVGPLEADTVGLLALIVMGLVLTTITTIVMRRWALRHLLDIPNERSLHVTPTPRGGGLAVVATVVVLLVAGRAFVTESSSWQLPYVGVALGIAGLGWVDDRYQVAPTHRLIIQLLLVGVFVGALGPVRVIEVPLIGTIDLWFPFATVVAVLWIAGFLNEFNFFDGVDGIAATAATIASAFWSLLLLFEGVPAVAFLSALLSIACFGFLFLNAAPARIFMGDIGSTFIGFTLAAVPVLAFEQIENPRLIVTGILLVAPVFFDTTLTLIRRMLKGQNVFHAHREHLYQRLIALGHSHAYVTTLYAVLAWLSGLAGVLHYALPEGPNLIPILLLILSLTLFALGVWFAEKKAASGHNNATHKYVIGTTGRE